MEKKIALLVVDDEVILREAIIRDFERKGFQVFASASGKEALSLIAKEKVEIVISDIQMPDGDGIFLLENLRKLHPELPPVILMTGYSDFSERALLEKGAFRYVSKPFSREDLRNAVSAAVLFIQATSP
jgi:CheY-like chemotaxis protein